MLEKYRQRRGKMDVWLALVVFALVIFGIIMIASASVVSAYQQFGGKNDYIFVWRQITLVAVGLALMVFFSNFDYRHLRKAGTPLLVITIGLLLAVFIPGVGQEIQGARRWLGIGPLNFQPAEIAKLTLIIFLAGWFDRIGEKVKGFGTGLIPFISMLGVFAFLIIKQPDLGTLSVIVITTLVMFYIAGARYTHIIGGLLVLGAIFFAFVRFSAYRWQRLLTYLNPSVEKLGVAYHVNQAFLAIGSGGLWGLGFGKSLQKYRYLPEPYTDSIFAIIAEELGFIRASIIILAFAFVAWRGFRIARGAPDQFAKFLAYGITTWITVQALMNIATMVGVIPLTGIPLPFISYGRTALLTTLIGVGILLNISRESHLEESHGRE